MKNFFISLLLLCAWGYGNAQDTLDSIARVQAVTQIDEFVLTLELAGGDESDFDPKKFVNMDLGFRNTYSPKVEELAKAGNAAAQNLLGQCYLDGLGIARNPQKAFYWISKAAEQKNLKALCNLGYCYENGIGTEKDFFQAYSFYKLSALKGNSAAFNNLAQCYLNGTGTPTDSIKARAWFEKGAETGIRSSQTNAGYLYIAIEGQENYEKAFYWLKKASEQNSPNALEMLGMCYDNGWGCEVNHSKAQECYRKSYQLGNKDAKSLIK